MARALAQIRVIALAAALAALAGCGGSGTAATSTTTPTPPVTPPATVYPDVATYHNDAARTGVQPLETILTTTNVNSTSFGKLFTFPVDGYLYAQPLFVGGYAMSDGKTHNVVFASTSHGSVYAFDADGNNPAQGYLWTNYLAPSGEQVVTVADYGCGNPSPESGIIGTPVIDRTAGLLYVVMKSKRVANGATTYYQRLHALNLADGSEKQGGPVLIQASVAGTGGGAQGGQVAFDPLKQNQRAALLLSGGNVWIAWASHCDFGPYHGWLLGYNASNIQQQTAVFNNTPNGDLGGIWMGTGGPSADNSGAIYLVGGNGSFDANTGGLDYSDSALKLAAPSTARGAMTISDWFAPSNQNSLGSADLDVGTTDALLFNDPASSISGLAVATDKTGRLYLLNRASMGHYDTGSNGPDGKNGDLQDFTVGGSLYNNFAFLNNMLYVGADGQPLAAYPYTPGTLLGAGMLATTPSQKTQNTFAGGGGNGGASPVVSANITGTSIASGSAILWALDRNGGAAVLHAYDATNLGTELYNSAQASGGRDAGPPPVKFTAAVVANGRVFVGGTNAVVVYGLLK